MARRLLTAGYSVVCYDPSTEIQQQMQAAGASVAPSLDAMATAASTLILSLPNARIVESVMQALSPHLVDGTIILDTSTSEPTTSQRLAAQGEAQGRYTFIDAPVSGGPAASNAGTMTMLLGGAHDAIESLQPLLSVLTAKTVIVGGSGAGHAAKIANNMLCAANLVLVAEAVRLGQASGVNAQDLLEGINAGSGRSGVSEVNFPKWVLNNAFDSGFTMGLMRKDVGLAIKLAESTGVSLPGFDNIAKLWLTESSHLPDNADFNEITRTTNETANNV